MFWIALIIAVAVVAVAIVRSRKEKDTCSDEEVIHAVPRAVTRSVAHMVLEKTEEDKKD